MYYTIKHETSFRYSEPISESVMELYMQPRSEGIQRCLRFKLLTHPRARIFERYDHLGNVVHFFDIPVQHEQLTIIAEATVERVAAAPLPDTLDADTWEALDHATSAGDFWDMLAPSPRIQSSGALQALLLDLAIHRRSDPLSLLREITSQVYDIFDYVPNSTDVDSPIDVALESRQGVCQDFAHVMIALVRTLGIPCRYVSGYLYYHRDYRSTPDATHAWVEAYLPPLGWIGFDPTNNILAGERHIQVAVGRDYSDVPPTHGVFKGQAGTELSVAVHISSLDSPFTVESSPPSSGWLPEADEHQSQQQ